MRVKVMAGVVEAQHLAEAQRVGHPAGVMPPQQP